LDKEGKIRLRRILQSSDVSAPFSDYNYFSYEERLKYLKLYSESNKCIVRDYIHDESDELFTNDMMPIASSR